MNPNQPLAANPKLGICSIILRTIAVIGISVPNLFITTRIIGKFELIFKDMRGDEPLPLYTQLIINHQSAWFMLAVFWALAVTVSAICMRDNKNFLLLVVAFVILTFLQANAMIISLFIPLIDIINQIQSSS